LFCFPLCFLNTLGHIQSNFPIDSDGTFLSSSFFDSCSANAPIRGVLRSNELPEPNWRSQFHTLNSLSQSDPASVTTQEGGNASPAMNEIRPGTTTKETFVAAQAPASMCVNSGSVSNKIDESDVQPEKHSEQRI
jgi:hypothetical protein